MAVPIGKQVRQSYFLPEEARFALLLDLSRSGSTGPTPVLAEVRPVLETATRLFHAIILNPGAMEKHADLLGGKVYAAGLVRADWTNALRPDDFPLPVQKVHRVVISDAEDALLLGASGMVCSLLMGFDDEFEADNIEQISHLARACYSASLPLVAEVLPVGPKVRPVNHDGVVKLAASFLMEAGVDAVIVPPVRQEERELLANWLTIPVLERRDVLPPAGEIAGLRDVGYGGVVLGEEALTSERWTEKVAELRAFCEGGEEEPS